MRVEVTGVSGEAVSGGNGADALSDGRVADVALAALDVGADGGASVRPKLP